MADGGGGLPQPPEHVVTTLFLRSLHAVVGQVERGKGWKKVAGVSANYTPPSSSEDEP